jgi:hypothetical protein
LSLFVGFTFCFLDFPYLIQARPIVKSSQTLSILDVRVKWLPNIGTATQIDIPSGPTRFGPVLEIQFLGLADFQN